MSSGHVNEHRCIGPPGTGKTTFLSSVLAFEAKAHGSERVVALSHTRAAAAELTGRKTPIPSENIGTLHAFAFRALDRPEVAESSANLKVFGEAYPAWRMEANVDPEDLEFGGAMPEGDKVLSEYARLRNTMRPRDLWPVDVRQFATCWETFKGETSSIDFTDMIELALLNTEAMPAEPATLVVDEAQDMSRLQWALVMKWAQHETCETLVTAGDVDQAIFRFAGADPEWFAENPPARRKVLEQSYRVPKTVHKLAVDWIRQIANREDVTYYPRDCEGSVKRCGATYTYPEPLLPIIEEAIGEGKTVMVQATCGYMLHPILSVLRREGIPFANPWRRKQSAWNPLHERGKNSTIGAVRAYLAPHIHGRTWSKAEAVRWAACLKGVWGQKARQDYLETLPDDASEELVLERIMLALKDDADLTRALAFPDCLDWCEDNLLAAKRRAAEFPLHVARKRGAKAVSDEPLCYVGTMHSFKGSESSVNIVFPDLSQQGYMEWVGERRDDVIRLVYVAMTRTRETLHLCAPAGAMAVWP